MNTDLYVNSLEEEIDFLRCENDELRKQYQILIDIFEGDLGMDNEYIRVVGGSNENSFENPRNKIKNHLKTEVEND